MILENTEQHSFSNTIPFKSISYASPKKSTNLKISSLNPFFQETMAPSRWLLLALLAAASASSNAVNNCHPGCQCDVESFGLFDSFSLTRVDCQGLGPGITMPVAIPLDTTHLDLSFNAMGPLTNAMLAGPGYTTLVSLDLSNNHITKVSAGFFFPGEIRQKGTGVTYTHHIFQTTRHRCGLSMDFSGLTACRGRSSGNCKCEMDGKADAKERLVSSVTFHFARRVHTLIMEGAKKCSF